MKLINFIAFSLIFAAGAVQAAPTDDILALQKIVALQTSQIAQLKLDKQKNDAIVANLIKNQTQLLAKVNERFNKIAIATSSTGYSDTYVARAEINGGFTHTAVHCGSGVVSDFRFWVNPGSGFPQFDRANCINFGINAGADIVIP